MKLYEEFKLYENMWDMSRRKAPVLKESLDAIATLKAKEVTGTPWYTEYFAVGPSVLNKTTNEVLTPENFDYWEDFEAALNDSSTYTIMPIVFGPSLTRTYSKEQHATLDDALDNVINNLYIDSDLSGITSHNELFNVAMMDPTITDNSVTFIVAYGPDNQDAYGCFMRVSQKPLNSNKQLGRYYLNKTVKPGLHMLANMMDTGLVGEDYSSYPNFDKNRYAWQAK